MRVIERQGEPDVEGGGAAIGASVAGPRPAEEAARTGRGSVGFVCWVGSVVEVG